MISFLKKKKKDPSLVGADRLCNAYSKNRGGAVRGGGRINGGC